jgi:hypothetical protein
MKRLAVAALLCLVLTSPAQALSMRVVHTPLVASRNGQAALFLVSTLGPEGGGSIEFLLVTPKQQSRFMVSSNFSPGGSSRPQAIGEAKCRIAVSRLQGALRQAGILDFAAHPDRCHGHAREQAVYVSEKTAGITPLPLDYRQPSSGRSAIPPSSASSTPSTPASARVLVVRGDDLVLHEESGTTTLPFVMPKAKSSEIRAFLFRGDRILAVVTVEGRSETLRIFHRPRVGDAFQPLV